MRICAIFNVILIILVLGIIFVTPLSVVSQDNEKALAISGFANKNIIENGKPDGPLTMVLTSNTGSLFTTNTEIAMSAEGRPMSGTIAIAEPDKQSQEIVTLDLDKSKLIGTKYENEKLVIETDARNGSPLVGEGAIYIIRINKEKIRIGNYLLCGTEQDEWIQAKMRGPSIPPEVDSTNVTISEVQFNDNK